MQSGSSFNQGFGVWIDYNQDDDFSDVDEFIYASPNASNNWFIDTIIISSTALPGSTRMRVRSKFNQTINANESCSNFNFGETEDYTVILGCTDPASCTPATTGYCCQIGIQNVSFGSINNSSTNGSEGYMDYTCSANTVLTMGQTYNISVETGPNYTENVINCIRTTSCSCECHTCNSI